jgi:hypothetical protein
MTKENNVKPIKETKNTQCFSYEVTMLVHIIADDEITATTQLNDKGGIVTKRDVKLVNTVTLYGEDKDK